MAQTPGFSGVMLLEYCRDIGEPLPPPRRRIVQLSRFCPLLALKIMGVQLRVHGWENYLKAEEEKVGVRA